MQWSTVVAAITLSATLSLVSVLAVFSVPTRMIVTDSDYIESPYRDDIEQLIEDGAGGMTPTESEKLRSLIRKNNAWFERRWNSNSEDDGSREVLGWKEKSRRLAPFFIIVWAISFLVFCYIKFHLSNMLAISGLVIMWLFDLLSVDQLSFSILLMGAIWCSFLCARINRNKVN